MSAPRAAARPAGPPGKADSDATGREWYRGEQTVFPTSRGSWHPDDAGHDQRDARAASEAIGHAAAILDRLEAKAKARAERAEHLASIRAREDS